MKSTLLLIFTLFFLAINATTGQTKLRVGEFTYNGLTLKVTKNPENNYFITLATTPNFKYNPETIRGLSEQIIASDAVVRTFYREELAINQLPNYSQLSKTNAWIKFYYIVNGRRELVNLTIVTSQNPPFTQENIGFLYKQITSNQRFSVTGSFGLAKYLNMIHYATEYRFDPNYIE